MNSLCPPVDGKARERGIWRPIAQSEGAFAVPYYPGQGWSTMRIRLAQVKFRAGAAPDQPGLQLTTGPILILVGPNGSGKSSVLNELEAWSHGDGELGPVLETVEVAHPTEPGDVQDFLEQFSVPPDENHPRRDDHIWVGHTRYGHRSPRFELQTNLSTVQNWAKNGAVNSLRRHMFAFAFVKLNGRTRFALSEEQAGGDLSAPSNHLQRLLVDDAMRREVRDLSKQALERFLTIDPTSMRMIRLRLNQEEPPSDLVERGLGPDSLVYHRGGRLIADESDGVQAYAGLVTAVAGDRASVFLVDEPEAFLHPPLARRAGKDLVRLAARSNGTLVASTHSPHFLSGCVESGQPLQVVRLTFESATPTARSLEDSALRELLRDPLLRSTGVLDAIFHRCAVICEADGDRAFYDEINRRIQEADAAMGVRDGIFLNAQNKTTERRLVKPLRQLGIPAAAIVDLDFIKQKGNDWRYTMEAIGIPPGEMAKLRALRDDILKTFLDKGERPGGGDWIKKDGISCIGEEGRLKMRKLLDILGQYGFFLVPGGELENWLPHLGVTVAKDRWVPKLFEALGNSPGSKKYVRPNQGDVWDFMKAVGAWCADPNRKGMLG